MLHSVYSASGSKRWLACPASIRMSKYVDNETSPAAELGTAAHELGEFCLRLGLNTYECLGLTFNKHIVDEEMADAVQLYVSYIRDLCNKHGVNPMLEKRVYMTSLGRHDVFGTSDCIVIVGEWLFVLDYKHGYGIVEVEDNSQAIFYAIATLDTMKLWGQIKYIQTSIIQPRADHIDGAIRSFDYHVDTLRQWVAVFANAIKQAESNALPVAGEHCLYCPARATCRARMVRTIDLVYGDKPLYEISLEELKAVYFESNVIIKHMDAIKAKMLEFARKGEKVEGYKLVKAIKHAKCEDESKFVEAALEVGIERDKLFTEKLKSMTNCKKIVPESLVNEHFKKADGASTLVPMSDNRPAMSEGSILGKFKPIEGIIQ